MQEESSLKELRIISTELGEIKNQLAQLHELIAENLTTKKTKQKTSQKIDTDIKGSSETLKVLKQFEKENNRGATPNELTIIRDISRPAIYKHLEELYNNNLVLVRRGTVIGLKPANSNFYYATERDPTQTLWDFNYLSSLEKRLSKVANTIRDPENRGISINELEKKLNISIESLDKIIKELLCKNLIDYSIEDSEKKYFVPEV